ncbi:MAG: gas vesicle protein, partial [Candidatus Altiarchaeota archaeon]|nr:gas vesicle protein [Candidatus Altiarchaeota archaeon]
MEPTRDTRATLVDLLDRVLDKGLIIHADVIISLSGVPLIGVNLRAAIAGMETMLEYGIMRDWDAAVRAYERKHVKEKEPVLLAGEELVLR